MKKVNIYVLILSLLILLLLHDSLFAKSGIKEIKYFGYNPGKLKMFIYLPSDFEINTKKYPVVVVLHGCSQKAKTIAKQSGWNLLADKYHFIVVYPQTKRFNNPSKCFNWFYKGDTQKGKGELASIKSMMDFTQENYNIDTSGIFIYGLSAGAAMGVAFMANYPEIINSGAIFAGGPYGMATNMMTALKAMSNPYDYEPEYLGKRVLQLHNSEKKYPRMIVVHGSKDRIVNKRNSVEIIDQWTYLHKTDTIPDKIDKSFADNSQVVRVSYMDSLKNEVVIYYKIFNTGHKLSVNPGTGKYQGGKTGLFAKNNGFFSTYYIAKYFGLME